MGNIEIRKGKIFSIEEFSTFDGPGIRMTVFLKGCPLKCVWCHNPEGQSFESEIVRSPNGCLGCGACLEQGRKKCGDPCLVPESIAVCPQNLVRLCGEDVTSEDICRRIAKKADMLNMCGGGVTFSGGEPLVQHEFLYECLRLLKGRVNRALQTTGFASDGIFNKILSECDFVLYDLKHMDPDIHKKYVGADNREILKNYRTLAESSTEFITRIPLIPGVNDTVENITETAAFLKENRVRRLEILPYNSAAGAKYKLVGREYSVDFDENATPDPHKEIFEKYDIEVTVL